MPIIPVFGHERLRKRLLERLGDSALPSSLLLHGPAGIGKQRLALWLGQALLCNGATPPCGACNGCRYAMELQHPDLHWIFPRPRPTDSDPSPEEIAEDLAEAIAERAAAGGLYARPPGSEAIFVATIRHVLRAAAMAPALANRKVFVLGDAERMVPQEGSEFAANAFLKLLEEPPANTFLILTSSEPASLLPTIRSRVVALRVSPLADGEVRQFLSDERVMKFLTSAKVTAPLDELVETAAGAPGRVLAGGARAAAAAAARALLDAALAPSHAARHAAALRQGVSNARGGFTAALLALNEELAARMRAATSREDTSTARKTALATMRVERARERAAGNVNPQLVAAALMRELREVLA